MSYQAVVTIAGAPLAPSWDGSEAVALANIEIVWGRQDLYEDTPPSAFSVQIADPTGLWATDNSLSGKRLRIGREDTGKTILRGTIALITSERIDTRHPVTGRSMTIWLVTVSGSCKLSDLDQIYLTGPQPYRKAVTLYNADPDYTGEGPWNEPEHQAGSWGAQSDTSRITSLMNGGLSDYVDAVITPTSVALALGWSGAPWPYIALFPTREYSERTALGHLRDLFRGYPLGHVNYDSDANSIVLGQSAEAGGMKLALVAGVIVLQPNAGLSVESSKVVVPDGNKVTSTVAYAIDRVQVAYEVRDLANVVVSDGLVSAPTLRSIEGTPTSRNLVIDAGFYIKVGAYATPSPNYRVGIVFGQYLANLTRDLVDDVNGMFTLPNLRFDMRRFEFSPDLVDLLLDTRDKPVPLFFEGSMFGELANIPTQHQIIGGTLRWAGKVDGSTLDAGWVLDATLAPATGTVDPESIEGLVTNLAPTLEDFHPSITLSDLDSVTIGLD